MNKNHEAKACRKPYEKPRIQQVELRPEEAVLQGCKILGGLGPKSADCITIAGLDCQLFAS